MENCRRLLLRHDVEQGASRCLRGTGVGGAGRLVAFASKSARYHSAGAATDTGSNWTIVSTIVLLCVGLPTAGAFGHCESDGASEYPV
jgi:hypothetical protein